MFEYPCISELERFYTEEKGQVVYKSINNVISALWPDIQHETIMGIGCATPFLKDYTGNHNMVISVVPSTHSKNNIIAKKYTKGVDTFMVAHENALPFADNSIDKMLVIHALEYSQNTKQMMREVWRVMKPDASMLMIVPNKLSIWPYVEKTPFTNCQLFTVNQVLDLLHDSMFATVKTSSALFGFTDFYLSLPQISDFVENFGNKLLLPFGGVIIIEAVKMICATNNSFKKNKSKKLALNIGH